MDEILHDIKSGALPADELPSFGAWLLRKLAWLLIALAICGTGIILVLKGC